MRCDPSDAIQLISDSAASRFNHFEIHLVCKSFGSRFTGCEI